MFDKFFDKRKAKKVSDAKELVRATCIHSPKDRRLVMEFIERPGHKQVICINCGLIQEFETQ